jgi:PPM family protein phosphatase
MQDDGREITAELPPQPIARSVSPLKQRPRVLAATTFGAKTDLGQVRENNEDKFDFLEPDDIEVLALRGCAYAVADGMGGHAAGQIASELALKTFLRAYYASHAESPGDALAAALAATNAIVYDTAAVIPGRSGMGCTLTAIAVVEDRLWVAHVGDSRAYLVRDGTITQLTEDHSWVAEQIRRGAMTSEAAENSPYRNVITRSIGAAPSLEPDVFNIELRQRDVLLLCSDGLSGVVRDEEMLKSLQEETAPSLAAAKLVETANERGGPDNITVAILRINDLSRPRWWRRK